MLESPGSSASSTSECVVCTCSMLAVYYGRVGNSFQNVEQCCCCLFRECASHIVESDVWKEALKNSSGSVTPLRRMIRKMPGK